MTSSIRLAQEHTPFIDMSWLYAHVNDPDVVIIDVRFALNDPTYGYKAYKNGHIPGALFMDLEKDLSAPPHAHGGHGGRHPLPEAHVFVRRLGELGIGPAQTVVIYDDHAGGFAARLWWMLKAIGHEKVFILNQGFSAWEGAGYPVEKGIGRFGARHATGHVHADPASMTDYVNNDAGRTADHIQNAKGSGTFDRDDDHDMRHSKDYAQLLAAGKEFTYQHMPVADVHFIREVALAKSRPALLIDARDEKRYLGEIEPIDPVAGHIPGAVNIFYQSLLSPETNALGDLDYLNKALVAHLPETFRNNASERPIICYCGSGVTSTALVAAFYALGYNHVYLYPGSYSDWVSYGKHPIARARHTFG
ncbi:MAG: Thiosulfate sulfurtransferase, rhodanese [Candidatus Carbobacillus altaicus]|uniref:Thiosulfate sulfurtransferase, rhodanese n=1 Tax=Candidatus Carbonibacillus altaicus TaxID=2163959 RepID=A0A2R6Y0C2_9BACL|nr:MAG: Thiosulfate sulfurtransferase, rhodanese [Candidatus Carbobacillus altaicus]